MGKQDSYPISFDALYYKGLPLEKGPLFYWRFAQNFVTSFTNMHVFDLP